MTRARRVQDTVEDVPRAIKTLRADVLARRSDVATLFEREATEAQKVVHVNVVRTLAYVGAAESGVGLPYIVMEYISGGDLASILDRQRRGNAQLDQWQLRSWMRQLAHGLAAIHGRVVHRDLKPQNVLIDGHTLKISDCGLARVVDAATQTVTAKGWGSAPYMAPETWRSEHATPATDIYSLGVLGYELATLALPYNGATREAFRDAHLSAAVAPRANSSSTERRAR